MVASLLTAGHSELEEAGDPGIIGAGSGKDSLGAEASSSIRNTLFPPGYSAALCYLFRNDSSWESSSPSLGTLRGLF